MACGRRRPASCNGSRSSCPRAVCTFTASRTGSPVCTQSGVMRCERCASYVAITRLTPTYSFPSAAGQSAPSASIASSSGSGKPLTCRSRSTRTCSAMPAGSSWPMMATTRGPCSTTLGTRTFSTRSGIPKWRPTGSKTFGGTDDGGTRTRSWPTVREIGVICMSRRIGAPHRSRNRCAPRHACRRGDKSCDHVRGRPFLVLRTRGPIAVSASIISRFGLRFVGSSVASSAASGDGPDGLLGLLVRHLLYAVRVLYLHLARHQQRKYFNVHGRLIARDLFNCFLAVLAEMQQQRLHELLIEQVTRAVPVAVRVA